MSAHETKVIRETLWAKRTVAAVFNAVASGDYTTTGALVQSLANEMEARLDRIEELQELLRSLEARRMGFPEALTIMLRSPAAEVVRARWFVDGEVVGQVRPGCPAKVWFYSGIFEAFSTENGWQEWAPTNSDLTATDWVLI